MMKLLHDELIARPALPLRRMPRWREGDEIITGGNQSGMKSSENKIIDE